MIGPKIRERRLALGISQEQLGSLVQISQKQVSRYESGLNDPTGDMIIALAQALNTSADYLLGLTDDPTRRPALYDLTPYEREVVVALRRGDKTEAIKLIVNG